MPHCPYSPFLLDQSVKLLEFYPFLLFGAEVRLYAFPLDFLLGQVYLLFISFHALLQDAFVVMFMWNDGGAISFGFLFGRSFFFVDPVIYHILEAVRFPFDQLLLILSFGAALLLDIVLQHALKVVSLPFGQLFCFVGCCGAFLSEVRNPALPFGLMFSRVLLFVCLNVCWGPNPFGRLE